MSRGRLDDYATRDWIDERQYLAGTEFHDLWYYGAIKLGHAQMKLTSLPGALADPDFLNISADLYTKAKLAIRGLLRVLVCYNVCCLGEWAPYLGPEELYGRRVKRDKLMDHLRSGFGGAGRFAPSREVRSGDVRDNRIWRLFGVAVQRVLPGVRHGIQVETDRC